MTLRERRSPNHGPRSGAIDMLVLHYTGMTSAAAALDRLASPRRRSARIISSRRMARCGASCPRIGAPGMPAFPSGAARAMSTIRRSASSSSIPATSSAIAHSRAADRGARNLCRDILARHAIPAAPRARPFGCGAAAQAGPGRAVPMGAARPRRDRTLARAAAAAGRRRAWRSCSIFSRRSAMRRRAPRATPRLELCSKRSSVISVPRAATAPPTTRRAASSPPWPRSAAAPKSRRRPDSERGTGLT